MASEVTAPMLDVEPVADFDAWGIRAFTTTRTAGSFSMHSDEPARDVMARWALLQRETGVTRLATAAQVHGARVLVHEPGWEGWLRAADADGHATRARGTAMAVTIADCIPVFIGHPSGMVALLHSGWRGTAARIVEQGLAALANLGAPTHECAVHLGPGICGDCYEVSPDVYAQLTGRTVARPTTVDLRALIADHARAAGVTRITISEYCTRCDNTRFFSHRAGDAGRQLGVLILA